MQLDHPATARDVVRWQFSQPLDFTPGTTHEYCNFGYQLLGRVIERASGKSYVDYIRQDLLGLDLVKNPIGFDDLVQSRSRRQDRPDWEIWYKPDNDGLVDSAVDFPEAVKVPDTEGGCYWESYDSFGGLSASAVGLCKYMQKYWVGGVQRYPGQNYRWHYTFFGSLSGVASAIYQDVTERPDSLRGLEIVVLFNNRKSVDEKEPNNEALDAIIELAKRSQWPSPGGGAIEWSVAATNVPALKEYLTVSLVRPNPGLSRAQVSYTTYSRVRDCAPQSGIVSFAPGETRKNVVIKLRENGGMPPTFYLELISASEGGWIGPRRTCIVHCE